MSTYEMCVYLHCVCVNQVKTRGLPDDHAGPIRIIDIEGIDANMCCGTHVSNLSQLQVTLNTNPAHTHARTHTLFCHIKRCSGPFLQTDL